MYGGFEPWQGQNPNYVNAFENPGGYAAGFSDAPPAYATTSLFPGSSADNASGATSSAPTAGDFPGTVAGNAPGTVGTAGSSWCSTLLPQGVPGFRDICGGGSATAAPGATGACSLTNLPGCFPSIGDFATRMAVVVLGFIFVLAGLFMFGRTVPFVRHAVPNVLKP
jgi:hypothetical protein